MDGAELRRQIRARLRADQSPVTLLVGESAVELGAAVCRAVLPQRPAVTPVLIKPNIGGFEWFKDPKKSGGDNGVSGRTTNPELVRGVIRCLKERGHSRITLAEGWGGRHEDWQRLIRVSGYAELAREEGVRLVAMNDDGVFDKQGDSPGKPLAVSGMSGTSVPTLLMPKVLAEHLRDGLFISIPKLKTHRFSVVSLSIKGMQGTALLADASPAHRQKWRNHRELKPALDLLKTDRPAGARAYSSALQVFARRMVDILEVEAPHVVIVDGAPAMGGDGFRKLWPYPERFALGGTNPILVDRVGAELLGLWNNTELGQQLGGPRTSPLITEAARRFKVDIESPRVVGNGAVLLQNPRPPRFISMSGFQLGSPTIAPAASAPHASERDSARVKPRIIAPRIDTLQIDGKLEAAWARAPVNRFDTDWSGKPTGIATQVRFAWSSAGLFGFFQLEGTGLFTDRSRSNLVERQRLYQEDCVEIFLVPDPGRPKRYYEVELGPFGHFMDLSVDREARKEDLKWSSQPRIATQVDAQARTASIEVALGAPEIRALLRPGAELPLGIFRMEGERPRHYLAWSPTRTAKPNFHVPSAFGILSLR